MLLRIKVIRVRGLNSTSLDVEELVDDNDDRELLDRDEDEELENSRLLEELSDDDEDVPRLEDELEVLESED